MHRLQARWLSPRLNAYAPYFYRGPDGPIFQQLAKPDYNYFQWDWLRLPRDNGAMWTEPYFDEGGGNTIMITYSAPFRRDDLFWGIATSDIAMSQLMREGQAVTVGKTGYIFVVSKQGRFLTFPEQDKIMKDSIQNLNAELGQRMLSGRAGFLRTRDPWKNRSAWIAYCRRSTTAASSLAVVYPEDEALADARQLRDQLLLTGFLGLLGLLAALIFVARSGSKPLVELARAAQLVADGDLEQRLSVRAPTEEVRNLMNAFNKMTRDLQMRMQELRYTTTVKERFEGELNAARSIQMSLVPKHFPAFPRRHRVRCPRPAPPRPRDRRRPLRLLFSRRRVALLPHRRRLGKGVPAALFMAVTKTLLKASSSRRTPMAQMIAHVNDELCEQTDSGMFVSLLYAHLNTRTGALEFCNAGHPPPYLLKADHTHSPLTGAKDVALGAMSALDYHTTSLRLEPGDALFSYTDGVTEALDRGDRFYSTARLDLRPPRCGRFARGKNHARSRPRRANILR